MPYTHLGITKAERKSGLSVTRWIREASLAQTDRFGAMGLNEETQQENTARRKRNKVQKTADPYVKDSELEKLLKLPASPSAQSRGVFKREQAVIAELRRRTPARWSTIIRRFEPLLARRLAAIIWWDFLADKLLPETSSVLDDMIHMDSDAQHAAQIGVTRDELVVALHECGYSPWAAANRIKGKAKADDEPVTQGMRTDMDR